jgi:hypothetical protein
VVERRNERRSALAADLLESAAEGIWVTFELEGVRESAAGRTGQSPFGDVPVEDRSGCRRRSKFCDGAVADGDKEPLAALDTAKIAAEVAAQFGDPDRVRHVQ